MGIGCVSANPAPYYVASPSSSSKCSAVHIITVRGSTEDQGSGTPLPDGGLDVNPTAYVGYAGTSGEGEIGLVAAGVQTGSAKSVSRAATVYPASEADYLGSVNAGITNILKQIQYQVAICPAQKLVLLGYSQGAQIIGDTLSGTGGGILGAENDTAPLNPIAYSKYISAIIFWGDPRHLQGQPVVGSPAYSGYFPRPATQSTNLELNYGSKLQSYCTYGDEYCASGPGAAYTLNNGTLQLSSYIHDYSYPISSAVSAIAFVQGKIGV